MALDHLDNESLIEIEDVVHGNMVRMMVRAIADPSYVTGMANMSFWLLDGLLTEIQSDRNRRGMPRNKHCDDLLAMIRSERLGEGVKS